MPFICVGVHDWAPSETANVVFLAPEQLTVTETNTFMFAVSRIHPSGESNRNASRGSK